MNFKESDLIADQYPYKKERELGKVSFYLSLPFWFCMLFLYGSNWPENWFITITTFISLILNFVGFVLGITSLVIKGNKRGAIIGLLLNG